MGDNHRGSHTVCWLPPPRWPSPKILLPIRAFSYLNLDEAPTALGQHQFIKLLCLSTGSFLYFLSCLIFLESHHSLQYVRRAYGWLRQGLLDWFVAPTTALYHPTTVSVCSTYSSPTLSLSLLASLYRARLRVVNIYINIGQKQAVTLALPLG